MEDSDWIELGADNAFMYVIASPEHYPTDNPLLANFQGSGNNLAGINERHKRADNGEWCSGWVSFLGPGSHWNVLSTDPLHIEPSLLCRSCQNHGFIREGKWVPA